MPDPSPPHSHATAEERELNAMRQRAEAAKELLAKLGMKRPALWEMRAVIAALRDAEVRGAVAERVRCLNDIGSQMREDADNSALKDAVEATYTRVAADALKEKP